MPTPYLRWTGSKRWLIKDHINNYLPKEFNNYHEPFLGGGAMFFYLKANNQSDSRQFYLSDINEELINCYLQIRDNPHELIDSLKSFTNTKMDYYYIRGKMFPDDIGRAARFIFLNRTSFNGIYRVNNKGEYNVPYGNRPNVDFVTEELIISVSNSLQSVRINCLEFEDCLEHIQSEDLVFIDPPYTVAHENNGFIEYNQKLFSWEDQIRLREFIEKIKSRNAYFILTNASHPSISELYADIGTFTTLSRVSKVGGRNKTRGRFNELVIFG
jgi:DNA adenine methylase